jgi:CC domain
MCFKMRQSNLTARLTQWGYSLVELLVVTGLISIVSLGSGAVIVDLVSQNKRAEFLASSMQFNSLLRSSVVSPLNRANFARCGIRTLNGQVFNYDPNNPNAGVRSANGQQMRILTSADPGGILNIRGQLPNHTPINYIAQNTYAENFGYISDLSFSSARLLGPGATAGTQIYMGTLSVQLKQSADSKFANRRVPLGLVAVSVTAAGAIGGCQEIGDPQGSDPCAPLGVAVTSTASAFNNQNTQCRLQVGPAGNGVCPDGQRAFINEAGVLGCQPVAAMPYCGIKSDGSPRLATGSFVGVLRCDGATEAPDQAMGYWPDVTCGERYLAQMQFAKCRGESANPAECYQYLDDVLETCPAPEVLPAPTPVGGNPDAPEFALPATGNCRCGGREIINGDQCVVCSFGEGAVFDDPDTIFDTQEGYIRYYYRCVNGILNELDQGSGTHRTITPVRCTSGEI